MKKSTALKAERLDFSYGSDLVIKDANFSIEEGEYIGIIGPNGGGKTTLLRLMLGLLRPKSGKIYNAHTGSIGYVPQQLHFDRSFPITVLEVVLMGLLSKMTFWGSISKVDKKRAYETLEEVGLLSFAQKSFSKLSGGQRQRVLVARALVKKPKMLFLDESFSSCDAHSKKCISDLLLELKAKKNTTICMVTHELTEAVDVVDRVLCVEQGVSEFKASEVCEHFAMGLYHTPLTASDCHSHKKRKKKGSK